MQTNLNETAGQFVDFARQIAEEVSNWADWHNVVFGAEGKFSELFPTEAERAAFVDSRFYAEIEEISQGLRAGNSIKEFTVPSHSGRFVVRIPKSLHTALVEEAKVEGVSLNQLVLTKLAVNLCKASKDLIENHREVCRE